MTLRLLELKDSNEALAEFGRTLRRISRSADRNRGNYIGIDYTRYDSFTMLFDDDVFVAFSAVQSFNFPDDHCRILSRTFYEPSNRMKGLGNRSKIPYALRSFVPYQIDVARRLGKRIAMISMEFPRRRPFLQGMVDEMRDRGLGDWQLMPGMYQTCPAPEAPTCWQNVAACFLDPEAKLNLPQIYLEDWVRKFAPTS